MTLDDARKVRPNGNSQPLGGDATFDDRADIADAIRGAQLLLSYATECGVDIDLDAVKTIVESKDQLRSGSWNPASEVGLWVALNNVAKAVKPVSVASLEFMSDKGPDRAGISATSGSSPRKSAAHEAVAKYRNRFFAWLIVLLVVQMYWLVGARITNDFETIPKRVEELNALIDKLKLAGTGQADSREIKTLEAEREENFTKAGTRIEILQKWNSIWGLSFLRGSADNGTGADPAKSNDRALLTAGFVLTAMQVYLLPLLYGLVGACAYVLRKLAGEIENRTVSDGSETQYQLRFYLGALAGMAVGWFFTPESTPALFKSISPFALAFLAGYSVELLFAAMDRFITALSKDAK
jgi:hypothetical protein